MRLASKLKASVESLVGVLYAKKVFASPRTYNTILTTLHN